MHYARPASIQGDSPDYGNRRLVQAAVCRGGEWSLEETQLEAPGPREALVRLAASGVCRTDVELCESGVAEGAILGHEGAGVVEELGSEADGVLVGDHVVLSYQSCGDCAACKSDRPFACVRFGELNFGFTRIDGTSAYAAAGIKGHFFGQSSFATHTVTPVSSLIRVDRSLLLAMLAPLGCGFQTGAGTVWNSLDVRAGQGILIMGAGSVGLAAVMAARIAAADPIIAVDRDSGRLALARELGATHTVHTPEGDPVRRVARIAGNGLDRAVETTGDPRLEEEGLGLLTPGGSMALLAGGDGDGHSSFGVIQGDAVPHRFIPRLIDLWRQGRFPVHRLIEVYDFADINQAVADMERGETVKPVLRMDSIVGRCVH